MDRYLYDMIEAAQVHPDLDVTLWGPNFTGWNRSLSSAENYVLNFDCDQFDIIFFHPPQPNKNGRDIIYPEICGNKTIIIHEYHDWYLNFYFVKLMYLICTLATVEFALINIWILPTF